MNLDRGSNLFWRSISELTYSPGGSIYTLDLDSLKVMQITGVDADTYFKSDKEHQFCRVYEERIGESAASHFLFIGEKDGSYSHILRVNFNFQMPSFVSPRLSTYSYMF